MASTYWSADAFLAENSVSARFKSSIYFVIRLATDVGALPPSQRLPCTFLLDVPNLGHLEGTTDRDVRASWAMK